MPRQNQDKGGRVSPLTTIATIAQGGTGADNELTAVSNLGGIHRSKIDQPNGLAQCGGNNKLHGRYFQNISDLNGPTIQFDSVAVRGKQLAGFITNYANDSNISFELEGYTNAEIGLKHVGPYFFFNVPDVPDTLLTLNVHYNSGEVKLFHLDLSSESISTASALWYNTKNNYYSDYLPIKVSRPETYSNKPWTDIDPERGFLRDDQSGRTYKFNRIQGQDTFTIPVKANRLYFAGRKESLGIAYVIINGEMIELGESFTLLKLDIESTDTLIYSISAGSEAYLGIDYIAEVDTTGATDPYAGEVQVDWQIINSALWPSTIYMEGTFVYSDEIQANKLSPYTQFLIDLSNMSSPVASAKTRYIRFRTRYGSLYNDWSDGAEFVAVPRTNFSYSLIEYTTSPLQQAESFARSFIRSPAKSDNGRFYCLAGAPDDPSKGIVSGKAAGSVYVFEDGYVFGYVNRLFPPRDSYFASGSFGHALACNSNGSLTFVGAPTYNNGKGAIHIYKYDQEQDNHFLHIGTFQSLGGAGYALAANDFGVFIGQPFASVTSGGVTYTNAGKVTFYKYRSTILNEVTIDLSSAIEITSPTPQNNQYFGMSLTLPDRFDYLEDSNMLLFVGANAMPTSTTQVGQVYTVNVTPLETTKFTVDPTPLNATNDTSPTNNVAGNNFGHGLGSTSFGVKEVAGVEYIIGLLVVGVRPTTDPSSNPAYAEIFEWSKRADGTGTTTFTKKSNINTANTEPTSRFGESIFVERNATVICIGDSKYVYNTTATGAFFTYWPVRGQF